jgi:predicted regulator of Ras-like GTPase activity (Roadblock/LC7/MglB family)
MSRLQRVLEDFRQQVPEFVCTDVVDIASGMSIGGASSDPAFDASLAASAYAEVVQSNARALDLLGLDPVTTEDILITTGTVYLLLRVLGSQYYHCLAVSKRGNLGFARAMMKKFEPQLLAALGAAAA